MEEDYEEQVKKLAKKAADVHDSAEALRFSQAALNLAHALVQITNKDK
jgi:hypothetical protein